MRTLSAGLVLSLALLSLGLAGCGGSGGSGGGPDEPPPTPAISFDPAETHVTSDRSRPTLKSRVRLMLANVTTSELFISGDYSRGAIEEVEVELLDEDRIPLIISHRPPGATYNGTYVDRVKINACLDQACTRPLAGSPLSIDITYTVTGDPDLARDPLAPPLEVRSRAALPHDVLDADYDHDLEKLVMVAAHPANALYVYDAATGIETSVALAAEPVAMSIAPDGLTAAVAHRNAISIVDLESAATPQPLEPVLLPTTADAFNVVLDGRGRAHVFPVPGGEGASVDLHTIEVASGAEWLTTFIGGGLLRARLHPDGNHMFIGVQENGSVEKFDITGTYADFVNGADTDCSNRRGCGKVWFDEPGNRVYSQNGQVNGTDGPVNMHLPDLGKFAPSGAESAEGESLFTGLDVSAERNEIAAADAHPTWCNLPSFNRPCYPRFATFDSESLARLSLHSIAPIEIGGTPHVQRGLYVFYASDGSAKLMISRLDTMGDPDKAYYVSILD